MDAEKRTTADPEQALKEFVDRLVEEKNFKDVSEEVMGQIKEDVYDRAEDRINAEILAALPADKLEEFDKLLDGGDRQAIADFCEQNVPNLQQVVADALRNFRETYLGSKQE